MSRFDIPLLDIVLVEICVNRVVKSAFYHGVNLILEVGVIKNLVSLVIDNGSLLIHNVVVGKHVFTSVEVLVLELLLSGFD